MIDKKKIAAYMPLRILILAAVMTSFGACAKIDYTKVRSDHQKAFSKDIAKLTAEKIKADQPLDLHQCIEIALENNLDIKTADISSRLATLDRKIAFSNFLPHIDAGLSFHSDQKHQAIGMGGTYNYTSDREVTRATINAQQAIFMPETWFLYSAYKNGAEVSKLVRKRTTDMIRLNVTSLYYSCLSLEVAEKALQLAVERAQLLYDETEKFYKEGMTTASELEQVKTLELGARYNLSQNERQLKLTKSQLLEVMGLDPSADIELVEEMPFEIKESELSDRIVHALINRSELEVADRNIEINRSLVKVAIAQFLPKITGVAGFTNSSDSFVKYNSLFSLGASGVMSVFDGFANIYEYKAAKENHRQSVVAREQACMKIMLEVINASQLYQQSGQLLEVAMQNYHAAELLQQQTQLQWQEGLLKNSQRIDAQMSLQAAHGQVLAAKYQKQFCAATLIDVTGGSLDLALEQDKQEDDK